MKRALVIALVALLGVTGCSGIPTDGSVNAGDVINENVDDVDQVFLPSDPQAGSEPKDLLKDFMQAATSPQNNYEIARKFLARSIQQTWNPNFQVTIRTGNAVIDDVVGDEAALVYEVPSAATIDETGRYETDQDSSSVPLKFEFVKENGEWRISDLDDGIVLSADNFDIVFGSYPLYFFDPSYSYLVPDNRWFPKTNVVTTRITDALFAGPSSWLTGVVVTAFVPGTTSENPVSVDSGVALVDLSSEARDADAQGRNRMQQQLKASLANVQTVTSVSIAINGVEVPVSETGAAQAIVRPAVNPLPLVRQDAAFGYATSTTVTSAAEFSDAVIGLDAKGATLAGDLVAIRGVGGVFSVAAGGAPVSVDRRTGLVDPSIDSYGFIWSAQADRADSITAWEPNGAEHSISVSLPDPSARVVSMEVSRDGTRVLLYLVSDGRPLLGVAGISRDATGPVSLGEFTELAVGDDVPIDATWVDSDTVAAMSGGTTSRVTLHEIGGPSVELGTLPNGAIGTAITTIGDGGTDDLRVLATDGLLYRSRGVGWQSTEVAASFLATQQPG